MRSFKAVAAVAAVIGTGTGVAAVAAAQAPVPTVTVAASTTAVTASPTPVAPGATRFVFSSSEQRAEISVFLVAVKPGRTVEEVAAAVARDPDAALELVDVVASVALTPGGERAVTAEIRENTSYLLVNDAGSESPAGWVTAPLVTGGAPTGATAPAPDATVVMRDLRFGGSATLPRRGTIRVSNVGWAPHFAIAFPLRPGVGAAAAGRAIRSGRDARLGRAVDFRGVVEVTNLLTRNALADQEIAFGRRGRYVLVCFFENHHRQGMYRVVQVR